MKPWLARTLLSGAVALVLFAGLWLLLDSKWSGDVGRLRARPSANIEELLPAIDPADDAGPIYAEVGRVWEGWQQVEPRSQPDHHPRVVEVHDIQPLDHPLAEDPHPAYLDAPEFMRIEELMLAAAQKPHCHLWQREARSFEPGILPALAVLSHSFLLPAAQHGDVQEAWSKFESVLGLAAHMREDPLIVSILMSDGLARPALGALPRLLAQAPPDAERAQQLLAIVRRIRPEQDVLRALDGERVLFAEPAWDSIVEGKFPTGIWMRTDVADSLKLRVLRPWRLLDEAKYFELLEATRALLVSNPWQELPAQEVSSVFPITQIFGTGFRRLSGTWVLEERHARDLAEIALRLAIARAGSGSYPSTLDALGDLPREPLTDEPYAYARAGEGYTLSGWSTPR